MESFASTNMSNASYSPTASEGGRNSNSNYNATGASDGGAAATCALRGRRMSATVACICAVCDCGAHKCPATHHATGKLEGTSTYRTEFPAHSPQAMRDAKPAKASVRHGGVIEAGHFSGQSENHLSYHAHDLKEAKMAKVVPKMNSGGLIGDSSAKFTGNTESKAQFIARDINEARGQKVKPVNGGVLEHGHFSGVSESHLAYSAKNYAVQDARPQKIEPKHEAQGVISPSDGVFDGTTQYKVDFPRHDAAATSAAVNVKAARGNKGGWSSAPDDRDFKSQASSDYHAHPIHVCPAAHLPSTGPGGHPSVMHVDGHMLLDTTTHKWVAAQQQSNDESGAGL